MLEPSDMEVIMSAPNNGLTYERANGVFRYDPETGKLLWKVDQGLRGKAGNEAGYLTQKGYRRVELDRKSYATHRIIWLLCYGRLPSDQIDHKDGNKANNRLDNLREVTNMQNCQNRRSIRKGNTSGYAGVTYVARDKRWVAQLSINGVQKVVGRFPDKESAIACRTAAEKIHYPYRWAIA